MPFVLGPRDSIEEAARALVEREVHHAPVVDSAGRTVGFISVIDLLRALLGLNIRASPDEKMISTAQNARAVCKRFPFPLQPPALRLTKTECTLPVKSRLVRRGRAWSNSG